MHKQKSISCDEDVTSTRSKNYGKGIRIGRTGIIFFLLSLFVVVLSAAFLTIFLPSASSSPVDSSRCFDVCNLALVETIPDNLTYPEGSVLHMDTYESWMLLIDTAKSNIDIGTYYWTMREEDVVEDPSAWKGEEIFDKLLQIGKKGNIKLNVAQNNNTNNPEMMLDTKILTDENAAEVRTLDFPSLIGSGVLHTKMWITDEENFYVGSANNDWRALTQVKEMGIMATNCGCMARDLQKVFSTYWMLGKEGATIPDKWPSELDTSINMENPTTLEFAGRNETMFISIAPPQFLPAGRTSDLDAVLNIIDSAQEFVYIALMDYFPTTLYMKENTYWPIIDNRLRAAAFDRGVQVRLMPSWWKYGKKDMIPFLRSLDVINSAVKGSVEVRLFEVPVVTPEQEKIPYSRVNHNKYMVTEKTALITTSNWSGDYFLSSAGVSVVVSQTKGSVSTEENIHVQLRRVFERDWNSVYAKNLTEF